MNIADRIQKLHDQIFGLECDFATGKSELEAENAKLKHGEKAADAEIQRLEEQVKLYHDQADRCQETNTQALARIQQLGKLLDDIEEVVRSRDSGDRMIGKCVAILIRREKVGKCPDNEYAQTIAFAPKFLELLEEIDRTIPTDRFITWRDSSVMTRLIEEANKIKPLLKKFRAEVEKGK